MGNTHGLPAGLTDVTAIASGGAGDLALKTDGTVVASSGYPVPQPPPGLTGVRAISVGSYHVLALAAVTPPPPPVQELEARAGDGRVSLTWTNPPDPDFWYTRVLRSETGFADSPEPNADQIMVTYSSQAHYNDGNVHNGTTYYYSLFARDATGGWSERASTSATPEERVRPTIYLVRPDDGATDVDRDRNVKVHFSESMDAVSINSSTVSLRKEGDPARVGAVVTYDDATYTALLHPASLLDAGVTYIATVTTGARDRVGNRLAAAKSWNFTVAEDASPPQVVVTSPAAGDVGVAADTLVAATFSEDMRRAFNTQTFNLKRAGSTTILSSIVTYDPSNRVATLDPEADLVVGVTYVARLTTRIRDLAGNPLPAPMTWRFTVLP